MSSYAKQIADKVVTAVQALSGAPALVEYRKEDVLHPREANDAVIVTVQREKHVGRAFEGTVLKEYWLIVAVYRQTSTPGDVTTGVDTNPAFVLACKQALDVATLSGVGVVYGVTLVDNEEWERQPFRGGMEVSRFGLSVATSEPQNG